MIPLLSLMVLLLLLSVPTTSLKVFCDGSHHCTTTTGIRVHCPSIRLNTPTIIQLSLTPSTKKLHVTKQWILPSSTLSIKKLTNSKLQRTISTHGTAVRVPATAECFLQTSRVVTAVNDLIKFKESFQCYSRIRRERLHCRRPRGCGQEEPCAAPDNPNDECSKTLSRCKCCCRTKGCIEIECTSSDILPNICGAVQG